MDSQLSTQENPDARSSITGPIPRRRTQPVVAWNRTRISPSQKNMFRDPTKNFRSLLRTGPNQEYYRNNISSRPRQSMVPKPRQPCVIDSLKSVLVKEPHELVMQITNQKQRFLDFVKDTNKMTSKYTVVTIKILGRLCESAFNSNKLDILSSVCKDAFVDILKSYVLQLAFARDTDEVKDNEYVSDPEAFWNSLVLFYKTIIDLLPSTACDALREVIDATDNCILLMKPKNTFKFSEGFLKEFEIVKNQFKFLIDQRSKKEEPKPVNAAAVLEYDAPPEDYRTIGVFPNIVDILCRDAPFLRPNIVKGAYASVDHYLDVQFRLLREDFICPLREGIEEYEELVLNKDVDSRRRRFHSNVRFYENVRFVGPRINKHSVGIIVDFQAGNRNIAEKKRKNRNVNWTYSKRFMYGSLLCFTADNFSTLFFGTVSDRDVKELEKGYIAVELSQPETVSRMYERNFLMIENDVYFEPYYHVLKALQNMNESNFPMRNYIVDVQCKSNQPLYIQEKLDLIYKIGEVAIPVLLPEKWPTPADLGLNDSQYHAFQTALTQEFAVIQGPPGTGKTFLGLKIASVLLRNIPKPRMLVVCYTNHALDQFLEGLTPVTRSIVRMGNQSKNVKLEPFHIKHHRTRSTLYSEAFGQINHELKSAMEKLKCLEGELDMLNSNEGIIDMTYNQFAYQLRQNNWLPKAPNVSIQLSQLSHWLLGTDVITPSINKNVNGTEQKNSHSSSVDDLHEESDDMFRPKIEHDFSFDDIDVSKRKVLRFDTSLKILERQINICASQIEEIDQIQKKNMNHVVQIAKLNQKSLEYQSVLQHLQYRMDRGPTLCNLPRNRTLAGSLDFDERWSLYWQWVKQLKTELQKQMPKMLEEYREICKRYEEMKHIEDISMLKDIKVIGMTTTSSARLQPLLQSLKIPIVIIEEAAEVTESHIIASLTTHCQHLILIGDHKQLRPSTAVYKLSKRYNLNVSLFERMLNNGLHCASLSVQHRMRPEISSLITPNIYDHLDNHESVNYYPDIKGITKNLFFITHKHFEDNVVDDNITRRNPHEAEFVVQLCRYLILQGYKQSDVTILTTYTGQMYLIRAEKQKFKVLDDIQVTVVDNYQGEENKIILLSLVRSNEDSNVGFLATENRVCVALSRAKQGFYIIGDMDCLIAKNVIWPKIKESLVKLDALDTFLTLQCQRHPRQFTKVSTADDFMQVPNGGCNQVCNEKLSCGHFCSSLCHILDANHVVYQCREKCTRSCELLHPCNKLCSEFCGDCHVSVKKALPCTHEHQLLCYQDPKDYRCPTSVVSVLPPCGHEVKKKCFEDPMEARCTFSCDDRLPCGHSCVRNCHKTNDPDHCKYTCRKPCTRSNKYCSQDHKCDKLCFEECAPCKVLVKKTRAACSHQLQIECSADVESVVCKEKCKRMLPCNHFCKLKCYEPCGNCQTMVTKTIPECGHVVTLKCCEEPTISKCMEKCKKLLDCGHECANACKGACTTKCTVKGQTDITIACGHQVKLPCYLEKKAGFENIDPELLPNCDELCAKVLECGHDCNGKCTICFQRRIHKPCSKPCENKLICQHPCQASCGEACLPCKKNCSYRCMHSTCPLKCGLPCKKCVKPCHWKCEHQKCTMQCGQICNRGPCNYPCMKILPCSHPCLGFCGEECPTLCMICNKEKVTTESMSSDNTDVENIRFVKLIDCNHDFEVSTLDKHFHFEDNQNTSIPVKMNLCPTCKTPVMRTPRYANQAKQVLRDLQEIKLKVFGSQATNAKAVIDLHKLVLQLRKESMDLCKDLPLCKILFDSLIDQLAPAPKNRSQPNRPRQDLSKRNIIQTQNVVEIIVQVQKMHEDIKNTPTVIPKSFNLQINNILTLIQEVWNKISDQHIVDISLELHRAYWIAQLCKLEGCKNFQTLHESPSLVSLYEKCKCIINSVQRFTSEKVIELDHEMQELSKRLECVIDVEAPDLMANTTTLKQGLCWFKCLKRGHLYYTSEEGDAVECSECVAHITVEAKNTL